jgi:predicted phosphoadenosine phosphosulfate sulfurtransferase
VAHRIFLDDNVYEAATKRIEWLFSEFPNVYVCYSGGKDSTVSLQLTIEVAERIGRLPVRMMFIDQEAEFQATIDHIREVVADPRVEPYWLQIPMRIFNATSDREEWLMTWEPGGDWMRPKEPCAITENVYGTDRFGEMFGAFMKHHHPNEPCCTISGVRCEESPTRRRAMTSQPTYKGETWGKKWDVRRGHYAFYPLYDWSYTDIWKAIHDHDWPYCRVYDVMYQYGIPVSAMRVSNVHHETAVRTLFYLQEFEPETWDALVRRIPGINTAGMLSDQWGAPKELPFMFDSWVQYRDHLVENLVTDPEHQAKFRKLFASHEGMFEGKVAEQLIHAQIKALLKNDYHGTNLGNFLVAHITDRVNRRQRGSTDSEPS